MEKKFPHVQFIGKRLDDFAKCLGYNQYLVNHYLLLLIFTLCGKGMMPSGLMRRERE